LAIISKDISLAKDFLKKGQLVAIPTETVYGLAGNALDQKSVLSIFEVKNRPSFDPLIVHTDSLEKIAAFVDHIPDIVFALAKEFWPGPLTVLLPKKASIPDLVTSGLDTVAVRIPNHPLTLELLSQLDFPLAAPSANPFGYISPTNAQHVDQQLGQKIPYILDGGECGIGIESTIIGFPNDIPTIYRLGGLAVEAIEKVAGKVILMPHSSSNPQAPGMLKSHYAPKKPFFLSARKNFPLDTDQSCGYLLFDRYLDGVDKNKQWILSPAGDLKEAAQHLFSYLRDLDAQPFTQIWAEYVPDIDLGRAINDRLKRAAAIEN
jgi:L-threonylcarbamoyladenylate synthase